jgi:hypothetical protein
MSSARDQTSSYEAGSPPAGSTSSGGPGMHRGAPSYAETDYQRGSGMGEGAGQAGFTVLAATLMILSGLWGFFEGLVAVLRQSFFVSQPNYTFQFNVHGWGWIHLVLGIVIFAAGVCVLLGQTWAKALGIMLAVFSGIANFLFLPYYPVWSIVVIALDVFIIWALASGMGRRAAV